MARTVNIKIRRGLESNLLAGLLSDGEFGFTTDSKKLFVGLGGVNFLLINTSTSGDMQKNIYDTDNDGIVDQAEKVNWSGVQSKPTKLSEFTNDLGLNGDIKITTSSVSPSNPTPNEFWYVTDDDVVLETEIITTSSSTPSTYNPGDFWYKVL